MISILFILNHGITKEVIKAPTEEYFKLTFLDLSSFQSPNVKPYELLSYFWRVNQCNSMYTIGGEEADFTATWGQLPFTLFRHWIHLNDPSQFRYWGAANNMVLGSTIKDPKMPLISVMMTTFKSGDKLLRPWESLLQQTYPHWELIIWDDSPDDDVETYKQVQMMAMKDIRVKAYRGKHSGIIGEMKRRSGSLATGRWIVELDHDDRITPNLFQLIVDIDLKYPKCGFIYSDFIMVNYDVEEPTMWDCPAFGYGNYFRQFLRNQVHNVYQTQSINPVTAKHIVGVPNHVRIWKSEVYDRIGRHDKVLAVADDYDIILKSFLDDECEWVRIPDAIYIQYNNPEGNNFTWKRNKLIQELSLRLWLNRYQTVVAEKFKAIGFGEYCEEKASHHCWLRQTIDFPRYEHTYYHDKRKMSIVIPVLKSTHQVKLLETIQAALCMQGEPEIFIVGHPHSCLAKVMNLLYTHLSTSTSLQHSDQQHHLTALKFKHRYQSKKNRAIVASSSTLDDDTQMILGEESQQQRCQGVDRVKWWNFRNNQDQVVDENCFTTTEKSYLHHLMNYALKIGVRTEWVMYVMPGDCPSPHFITSLETIIDPCHHLDAIILQQRLIHREAMFLTTGKYWCKGDTFQSMLERFLSIKD